jgi:pimeloyl-ACP methyl ester carboxylesterase
VRIAIQETGNPLGPEIIFIHGLLGSHLDWMEQVTSSDLQKYRLITYDLRGHGLSGKPSDSVYYTDGKRWGDELNTVIKAAHLKKPILVGWSLGAVAITNYLDTYGDAHLSGIVFVSGVLELKPELFIGHPETSVERDSTDLRSHIEGTRQFVRQCFLHTPNEDQFEILLASAAMASQDMSRAYVSVSVPAEIALPKTSVPVLLLYGQEDNLVRTDRMIEVGRRLMPKAKVVVYTQSGHAPFLEQSSRFNHDLIEFSDQVDAR